MMEELMEELMERSDGSPHTNTFSSSGCLLPPDADFIIDEQSSHHSGLEVGDRLTYLEQRVQMQEDEIQLLKMTMADVLKRLNISEEQTDTLRRAPNRAVRPASLSLTPKASVSSLRKSSSSSSTLPSSPSSRNYSPSAGGKRTAAGASRDTPNTKAKSTSGATSRKLLESKPKEGGAAAAGAKRVTHCKVTMQIFLRPQSRRRTGSAEPQEQHSSVHKSPIKSPSQYFQICY